MESIITNEIWKDIDGFEGQYQISSFGRVKSLWRKHSVGIRERNTKVIFEEKILTPTDNGNGYKIIGLVKDGKRKNFYVHRLVAEHFVENIGNFNVVNHKDFDTSNNSSDNLEWCSQKQNVDYSLRHGRGRFRPRKTAIGEEYISLSRYGTYKVVIRRKEKCFKALVEAKSYRDKILEELNDKLLFNNN